jgi:undecaprenyl-diphosphatase
MDPESLADALVLGLVEGLTEFIPVSSTGHILLLGHFLGFESTGKTFEVLIQLGAILAILVVYFQRFWKIAKALPRSARARRFVIGIALAFLPAAFAGVALHGIIKTVLFESPALICIMLVLGGVVLLVVDRLPLKARYDSAYDFPPRLALGIGICQTMALIPGVSRSGATIVGALLLGADKRAAAEFSFFLALPTMAGAFAYDLYKNFDRLNPDDAAIIAVGFVAAFLAALFVVRRLLDFVGRSGFAPFAWWRIGVGIAGLAGLWMTGALALPGLGAAPSPAEEGVRLVPTTSVKVRDPVGELPLGTDAPAAAPAPEEPVPVPGSVAPPAGPAEPAASSPPRQPGEPLEPSGFDDRFSVAPQR